MLDHCTPTEDGRTLRELWEGLRGQAKRAFVIEFTGTPKAGKSTTIELLRERFEELGIKVHVMKEQAVSCPVVMKGHFFFNAWTTTKMLADLIDVVDSDVDLLILDRGCFDALVWLEMQIARHLVSDAEAKVFRDFVLLERWRSLVDSTVVMRVDPEVAMRREGVAPGDAPRGSLMNPERLSEFNSALDIATNAHGGAFALDEFDCNVPSQSEVVETLVEHVWSRLRDWVDPEILVLKKSDVESAMSGANALRLDEPAVIELLRSATPMRRSLAEADSGVVQLVAASAIRSEGGICVFDRSGTDRADAYGPRSTLLNAHVEAGSEHDVEKDARRVAIGRFVRSLHLSACPSEPRLLGLVWVPDRDGKRIGAHLGMVFEVEVSRAIAEELHEKKLKIRVRGHRSTTSMRSLESVDVGSLEPWSRAIFEAGWASPR